MTTNDMQNTHAPLGVRRIWQHLAADRQDVYAVLMYSIAVGMLNLAIPVAAQTMVNTVAFGTLLQPILVLALLLLFALGIQAVLAAVETYTVEVLQRRIFLRVVSTLAHRLPRMRLECWDKEDGAEAMNRAFDIFTIQKSVASLLVGALDIGLTLALGLLVLAFYHPYLLVLDLVLIAVVVMIFLPLGRHGIETAVSESRAKYRIVHWFESVASSHRDFRSLEGPAHVHEQTDALAGNYLHARAQHFRIVLRQTIALLATQALTGAVVLGVGGFLVLGRQLTLGQLVAAELIVSAVVAALSKAGKYIETYYDLLAAIDKVEHITELPLERSTGDNFSASEPIAVAAEDITLARHQALTPVSLQLAKGARVGVTGDGRYRHALLDVLSGQTPPRTGVIRFDGQHEVDLHLPSLRRTIALVRAGALSPGTLADNLRFGASSTERVATRSLMDQLLPQALVADLDDEIHELELSQDEQMLMLLMRAMLKKPRLLVVDGVLDLLPQTTRARVMPLLCAVDAPWSLVVHSQNPEVLAQLSSIWQCSESGIVISHVGETP